MVAARGTGARVADWRAGILSAALVVLVAAGAAEATPLADTDAFIAAPSAATVPADPSREGMDAAALLEDQLGAPALGMTALAETLREDAAIAAVLRNMLPDPSVAGLTGYDLNVSQPAPQAALAPSDPEPVRAAAVLPDAESPEVEVDDEGHVTLRQVLQAMQVASLVGGTSASLPQREIDDLDDGIDALDVRRRLLDSRFLGEALAQVVTVDSVDGSFSILGVVQFSLNGHQTMTDSSSGGPSDPANWDPNARQTQQRRDGPRPLDPLAITIAFVETPTGEFVSGFFAVAFLGWSTARVAGRLKR